MAVRRRRPFHYPLMHAIERQEMADRRRTDPGRPPMTERLQSRQIEPFIPGQVRVAALGAKRPVGCYSFCR